MKKTAVLFTVLLSFAAFPSARAFEGASIVSAHGYSGCVRLDNGRASVLLDPNCGGRVLEYAIDGRSVIYLDPAHDGYTWKPGGEVIDPSGGRFDIGPETTSKKRPMLWRGPWTAEITGPRRARLTSVEDESAGVRLVRDFDLDPETSRLRCTQTIINVSGEPAAWNHWSRTFAEGGGICVVPLSERSRFPNGYIIYGPGPVLNYRHDPHPNVRVREGFLEILGPPPQRKFGIDTDTGWLGYVTRSGLLFVKKFQTFPYRPYGEIAAYTISIWYNGEEMCELEPIGPTENLGPGESASFTEDWYLFPYDYPADKTLDLAALSAFVGDNARAVAEPGSAPAKLAGGFTWAEGPVETPEGKICFTDNRENLVHSWSKGSGASVLTRDGHRANGMYRDRDGSIVACLGDPKAVAKLGPDGAFEIIADNCDGKPFNAPNDLWIDGKGGIYFTDPYWGREEGRSRVYYIGPDRKTVVPVIFDMVKPNGIVGSPDGTRLYVSDWVVKKTYVFRINGDGTVWDRRLFAPEGDDGMTVDTDGNVYLTGAAVTVWDPNGMKIDTIECPETPANVIFYGPEKRDLFITARTSVYTIRLRSRGL